MSQVPIGTTNSYANKSLLRETLIPSSIIVGFFHQWQIWRGEGNVHLSTEGFCNNVVGCCVRRPGSGIIFRAIITSTSPTYTVLLHNLYLHYAAGKITLPTMLWTELKWKTQLAVLVMNAMEMPKGLKTVTTNSMQLQTARSSSNIQLAARTAH
jgi:hypothetical protein